VTVAVLDVELDRDAHPLHGPDRTWTETNCYADLWIEVLHALGLDPVPAAACTLSAGFEGDQWTFLKFPPEDLRALYGIEVAELNVWRDVEDHVVEQLGRGCLLSVEVDAWHLPDVPVSYRSEHVKTTIVPNVADPDARTLRYFHNAGYFELTGDDYDGIFRGTDAGALAPYVELVRLDRLTRRDPADLAAVARGIVADHLARRPLDNPVEAFRKRLEADAAWLPTQPLETFHLWAFATCRQLGATAELAASLVRWLDERGSPNATSAPSPDAHFQAVADGAKSLQFSMARAARGRAVDPRPLLDDLAAHWDAALAGVATRDGR
jgi:hypothetical protein